MYPDTDLPPKQVTEERLERIRRGLPVPIWTREAWYRELGLPADVVEPLAVSRLAGLFEILVEGLEDRPDGRGRGPCPVPQTAEKEWFGPGRPDRGNPPQDLRPASATGRSPGTGVLALMETGRPRRASARSRTRSGRRRRRRSTPRSWPRTARSGAWRSTTPRRRPHVLMGLVMTALRGRVEGAAVAERVRAAAEGTC